MITTVDITLLDEETRDLVLAKYRVALMDPTRKMTMQEAAWLYGYTYQTIRWLVAHEKMRSTGHGKHHRLTHAAVRAYRMQRRKLVPTRKERSQQLVVA